MLGNRSLVLLLFHACAVSMNAAEPAFTDELWTEIKPIYAQTLEHPFLKGLADGTLARARFEYYLVQDSHYLRAFAQTLSVLAAKAPKEEWAITLNRHSADSLLEERQLHESVLGSFGVTPSTVRGMPVAPTNYAYTNHLLATAFRQPFPHGLAAVLPCYWIYWEVGRDLKKRGSKNAVYQRWIDQYADPSYGKAVREVLDMMNSEAAHLDPDARRAIKDLFTTSARYEWMFWDMAWREEKWKP